MKYIIGYKTRETIEKEKKICISCEETCPSEKRCKRYTDMLNTGWTEKEYDFKDDEFAKAHITFLKIKYPHLFFNARRKQWSYQ